MKNWLDKVIELQKELEKVAVFSDDLRICTGNIGESVHVFEGIEQLAEAVGEEIKTKFLDDEYPIEKYFMYKGMNVFQLEKKEGKK